jgi:hypothetical protein
MVGKPYFDGLGKSCPSSVNLEQVTPTPGSPKQSQILLIICSQSVIPKQVEIISS